MTLEVSVIIVNWNAGDFLKETIESLYENTQDVSFEVIIIDNKSSEEDSSYLFLKNEVNKYDNLKVIYSENNLGFAKANNLGMEHSTGKNILLLNPDVTFKSNTIKILSDYLNESPETGMIGPKVLNPDGSFQGSCMRGEPNPENVLYSLSGLAKIFKNNPKFNKFSLFHLDINEIQSVASISGCCMMVKQTLIDQIGKMDDEFFLYQEETDWCLRAYRQNWKILYNPNAVVVHFKGASTKKVILKSNYIFCLSMMKLFKKHYFNQCNIFEKCFFITLIWANFFVKYFQTLCSHRVKNKF